MIPNRHDDIVLRILSDAVSADPTGGTAALLEGEVYDLMDAIGLQTPKRVRVSLADIERNDTKQVELITNELPGKYVFIKAECKGLLHKTEAGAVQRSHNSSDEIYNTCSVMFDKLKSSQINTKSDLKGAIVVEEVKATSSAIPVELLLGARWTHDFGPVVTLGVGGVGTEFWASKLKDEYNTVIASAINFTEEQAKLMIQNATLREMWQGYRGQPPLIDETELVKWLMAWADLISIYDGSPEMDHLRIEEAEINPLVIRKGSLIPLDGLIRVRDMSQSDCDICYKSQRTITSIKQLLHPKRIGVAGVSGSRVNIGRIILQNLLKGGFKPDQLAIIKPNAETNDQIDLVNCYSDIQNIPWHVDLLILAVDAATTPDLLSSGKGKVTTSLLIAGGTSEHVDGTGIASKLENAIDQSGIISLGPNSLGFISRPAGVDTLFLPQHKIPRNLKDPAPLAYISQSGAFMITRMNRLQDIEPRYAISTGNQMRIGTSDVLASIAIDPAVRVFAVYVEGFAEGDGIAFATIAQQLVAEGKTVVIYKAGRTEAGAAAASGHTASIAGDDRVSRQILKNAGVIVSDSFNMFEDVVRLAVAWADRGINLNTINLKHLHTIGVISNAGYECVGVSDSLEKHLITPQLENDTLESVTEALATRHIDQIVSTRNPVDLTPMADQRVWELATLALINDDSLDYLLISPVPASPAFQSLPVSETHNENVEDSTQLAGALAQMYSETNKPIVFCVDCGRIYDQFAKMLGKSGAPVFRSSDRAINALNALIASVPNSIEADC